MKFEEMWLPGAFMIELDRHQDSRGFFARTFCREEFVRLGLDPCVEQCNVSFSPRRGTVRGLHFQRAPHQENRLVRCTRGSAFDVMVDLRRDSPSFLGVATVVLTAERGNQVYIPTGMAHGLQTLMDNTEICYQMSASYAPESVAGYRYDDPSFEIEWPQPVSVISERDLELPLFRGDA